MGLLDLFKTKAAPIEKHTGGAYVNDLADRTIEASHSKPELYATYNGNWAARVAIDTLTREIVKLGYGFLPKYEARCTSCDMEYDYMPTECKCGATTFDEPDTAELKRPQEFVDDIDPDGLDSFHDHLTQTTRDLLIYDEMYDQVQRAQTDAPLHLWRQDPRYMTIIFRSNGRLGGDAWFCSDHRTLLVAGKIESTDIPRLAGPFSDESPPSCPECSQPCERIAFVLNPRGASATRTVNPYGGAVTMPGTTETRYYYARNDFIYDTINGAATRLLSRPLLQTAHTMAITMMASDWWNRDNYIKQAAPNTIVLFKGINAAALESAQNGMKAKSQRTNAQGRGQKSTWLTGDHNAGIDKLDSLPSMVDLEALKFQQYYRDNILMLYGISPKFVGVETSGKLGGPDGYQADRDTVKSFKKEISEKWNRFFVDEFGIEDHVFALIEEEDDTAEQDARVLDIKASAIQKLKAAGIYASLDPDTFEVIIDDTEPEEVLELPEPPMGDDEDEDEDIEDIPLARPSKFRTRSR